MTTEKGFFMTLIKPNSVMETLIETKYPGLEFFQDKVGGYIAPVPISLPTGEKITMLVDEDGLSKELTPNIVASTFAGKAIYGNVLTLNNFTLK